MTTNFNNPTITITSHISMGLEFLLATLFILLFLFIYLGSTFYNITTRITFSHLCNFFTLSLIFMETNPSNQPLHHCRSTARVNLGPNPAMPPLPLPNPIIHPRRILSNSTNDPMAHTFIFDNLKKGVYNFVSFRV